MKVSQHQYVYTIQNNRCVPVANQYSNAVIMHPQGKKTFCSQTSKAWTINVFGPSMHLWVTSEKIWCLLTSFFLLQLKLMIYHLSTKKWLSHPNLDNLKCISPTFISSDLLSNYLQAAAYHVLTTIMRGRRSHELMK